MTLEQNERMVWLCSQIQLETDPPRFSSLVNELNELLEKKEPRVTAARQEAQA